MTPAPMIRITATPKKAVPVELLGVEYMIKPPKSSLLLIIAEHSEQTDKPGEISRDFDTILKLMFNVKKGQYEAVKARLAASDDELDLDHIFEAVEAITEEKTGNPTS